MGRRRYSRRSKRVVFGGNRRKNNRRFVRNMKRRYARGRRGKSVSVHKYVRQQQVTLYNDETTTPDQVCVSSNPTMWGSGVLLSSISPGVFDPYANRVATWCGNKYFTAADTVNATEFQALYDQYKLLRVDMDFEYMHNVAGVDNTGAAMCQPTLHIVTDWDGDQGTQYMSINDMMEHGKSHFKRRLGGGKVRYSIKPKVRDVIYQTTGTSAIAIPRSCPWIDTSAMNARMNGIKWCIQDWPMYITPDAPGATSQMAQPTLRITFTYHYLFKGVQ